MRGMSFVLALAAMLLFTVGAVHAQCGGGGGGCGSVAQVSGGGCGGGGCGSSAPRPVFNNGSTINGPAPEFAAFKTTWSQAGGMQRMTVDSRRVPASPSMTAAVANNAKLPERSPVYTQVRQEAVAAVPNIESKSTRVVNATYEQALPEKPQAVPKGKIKLKYKAADSRGPV